MHISSSINCLYTKWLFQNLLHIFCILIFEIFVRKFLFLLFRNGNIAVARFMVLYLNPWKIYGLLLFEFMTFAYEYKECVIEGIGLDILDFRNLSFHSGNGLIVGFFRIDSRFLIMFAPWVQKLIYGWNLLKNQSFWSSLLYQFHKRFQRMGQNFLRSWSSFGDTPYYYLRYSSIISQVFQFIQTSKNSFIASTTLCC